jgi:hypothetical protein
MSVIYKLLHPAQNKVDLVMYVTYSVCACAALASLIKRLIALFGDILHSELQKYGFFACLAQLLPSRISTTRHVQCVAAVGINVKPHAHATMNYTPPGHYLNLTYCNRTPWT